MYVPALLFSQLDSLSLTIASALETNSALDASYGAYKVSSAASSPTCNLLSLLEKTSTSMSRFRYVSKFKDASKNALLELKLAAKGEFVGLK